MSNDIKRAKRSTITHIVILIASICSIAGKGLLDIPQLLGSRTGMPTLSFWIILVVLTVIVWIVLFFLYSKEMPKWVRRFALFSVIGIPIATGVFIVKTFLPPSKINILVAEFDGPEPQTYRVTETIINQLRKAIGAYEDVQVKALYETITEARGQ